MEFLRIKNLNYTKQCAKLQINSSKNQRCHLPRNFMLKIKTTFAAVNIVVRCYKYSCKAQTVKHERTHRHRNDCDDSPLC